MSPLFGDSYKLVSGSSVFYGVFLCFGTPPPFSSPDPPNPDIGFSERVGCIDTLLVQDPNEFSPLKRTRLYERLGCSVRCVVRDWRVQVPLSSPIYTIVDEPWYSSDLDHPLWFEPYPHITTVRIGPWFAKPHLYLHSDLLALPPQDEFPTLQGYNYLYYSNSYWVSPISVTPRVIDGVELYECRYSLRGLKPKNAIGLFGNFTHGFMIDDPTYEDPYYIPYKKAGSFEIVFALVGGFEYHGVVSKTPLTSLRKREVYRLLGALPFELCSLLDDFYIYLPKVGWSDYTCHSPKLVIRNPIWLLSHPKLIPLGNVVSSDGPVMFPEPLDVVVYASVPYGMLAQYTNHPHIVSPDPTVGVEADTSWASYTYVTEFRGIVSFSKINGYSFGIAKNVGKSLNCLQLLFGIKGGGLPRSAQISELVECRESLSGSSLRLSEVVVGTDYNYTIKKCSPSPVWFIGPSDLFKAFGLSSNFIFTQTPGEAPRFSSLSMSYHTGTVRINPMYIKQLDPPLVIKEGSTIESWYIMEPWGTIGSAYPYGKYLKLPPLPFKNGFLMADISSPYQYLRYPSAVPAYIGFRENARVQVHSLPSGWAFAYADTCIGIPDGFEDNIIPNSDYYDYGDTRYTRGVYDYHVAVGGKPYPTLEEYLRYPQCLCNEELSVGDLIYEGEPPQKQKPLFSPDKCVVLDSIYLTSPKERQIPFLRLPYKEREVLRLTYRRTVSESDLNSDLTYYYWHHCPVKAKPFERYLECRFITNVPNGLDIRQFEPLGDPRCYMIFFWSLPYKVPIPEFKGNPNIFRTSVRLDPLARPHTFPDVPDVQVPLGFAVYVPAGVSDVYICVDLSWMIPNELIRPYGVRLSTALGLYNSAYDILVVGELCRSHLLEAPSWELGYKRSGAVDAKFYSDGILVATSLFPEGSLLNPISNRFEVLPPVNPDSNVGDLARSLGVSSGRVHPLEPKWVYYLSYRALFFPLDWRILSSGGSYFPSQRCVIPALTVNKLSIKGFPGLIVTPPKVDPFVSVACLGLNDRVIAIPESSFSKGIKASKLGTWRVWNLYGYGTPYSPYTLHLPFLATSQYTIDSSYSPSWLLPQKSFVGNRRIQTEFFHRIDGESLVYPFTSSDIESYVYESFNSEGYIALTQSFDLSCPRVLAWIQDRSDDFLYLKDSAEVSDLIYHNSPILMDGVSVIDSWGGLLRLSERLMVSSTDWYVAMFEEDSTYVVVLDSITLTYHGRPLQIETVLISDYIPSLNKFYHLLGNTLTLSTSIFEIFLKEVNEILLASDGWRAHGVQGARLETLGRAVDSVALKKLYLSPLVDNLSISDVVNLLYSLILSLKELVGGQEGVRVNVSNHLSLLSSLVIRSAILDGWGMVVKEQLKSILSLDYLYFVYLILHDFGSAVDRSLTDLHWKLSDKFDVDVSISSKVSIDIWYEDQLRILSRIYLNGDQYDCWCLSLDLMKASIFTNYNFDSFASIGPYVFATKSDGVYILEGDTDDGKPIPTGVRVDLGSLGSHLKKRFYRAYFGISSSGTPRLKAIADDHEVVYNIIEGRANIAVGQQGRRWIFELTEVDSMDFIELVPIILSR